jgi:hypothetical protein
MPFLSIPQEKAMVLCLSHSERAFVEKTQEAPRVRTGAKTFEEGPKI